MHKFECQYKYGRCVSKDDEKVMRSFEYTLKKLCEVCKVREKYKVEEVFPSHADSGNKKIPKDVHDIYRSGALYWRDFDIYGRPILWVRNSRKNWWKIDLDAETRAHIWMLEWGLRILPPGVSQFVLVADAQDMSMRQLMQFSFMRMLMKVFLELYPDRIAVSIILFFLRNLTCMPPSADPSWTNINDIEKPVSILSFFNFLSIAEQLN